MLIFSAYEGWGVSATNLAMVPTAPLPANYTLPDQQQAGAAPPPPAATPGGGGGDSGGGGSSSAVAIGVGVGVGVAVLGAAIAGVLLVRRRRRLAAE